ncbi:zinc-ribbon domain-containing protein [Butyrivibrio sp. YAB3001]|uniref:zinc-ribbon domain-containing protein n=1 Tax=Butyrivibrio sp. YAB3001 TaxID=1520812 RepID=UPI0008F637C0|nr:zinc-ribbon domain-containing protein [Butyrivibrio sp. YAB3001]SFB89083.1 Uncharacterized membrane protein [Butyrivibrio sp. YAB3001]
MKTCPNCGNQVADEASFCNNCGTSMSGVSSSAQAASAGTENTTATAGADTQTSANSNVNQTPVQGFQPQFNQNFQGQQGFQNQQMYRQAFDPADHTSDFDPRDIADNKLFAVLPYFTSFMGIVIALLVKESAYTKFHAKNAIRLMIADILILIPAIIPILGWFISIVLGIVMFIIRIIAIVQVFQGKAKDLPIVGSIGFLK